MDLRDELAAYGVDYVPDMPAPVDVAPALPQLAKDDEFEFCASFTGKLGSLGLYRFAPMVPIEKGVRYRVCINRQTGAAQVTSIPQKESERTAFD